MALATPATRDLLELRPNLAFSYKNSIRLFCDGPNLTDISDCDRAMRSPLSQQSYESWFPTGSLNKTQHTLNRFRQTRRWAIGLQALIRGWIGRRIAQSRRTHAQRLGEERAMGRVRWDTDPLNKRILYSPTLHPL